MRKVLQNADAYKKNDDLDSDDKASLPAIVVVELLATFINKRSRRPTLLGWAVLACFAIYALLHMLKADPNKNEIDINPKFKVQEMLPRAPEVDPQFEEFDRIWKKHGDKNEPLEIPRFDPNVHKVPKEILEGRKKDIYGHPHPKEYPVPVLFQPTEEICEGEILLLFIIESAVIHSMERRVIRDTWGRQSEDDIKKNGHKWASIFVTGVPHSKFNSDIQEEATKHMDILQGEFVDSPHEGTRKFMLSMDWVMSILRTTCLPKYIIHTEDSVFHNVHAIVNWIETKLEPNPNDIENTYIGRYMRQDIPVRDPEDFYYVPEEDYKAKTFPDLIEGPEFFFPFSSYAKMHEAKKTIVPIAKEDGYIGLLAQSASVRPKNDDRFVMVRIPSTENDCIYTSMLFIYQPSAHHQAAIYKKIIRGFASGKCN